MRHVSLISHSVYSWLSIPLILLSVSESVQHQEMMDIPLSTLQSDSPNDREIVQSIVFNGRYCSLIDYSPLFSEQTAHADFPLMRCVAW